MLEGTGRLLRRLRGHVRQDPAYSGYPKYAILLACSGWICAQVPVSRESFAVLLDSPSLLFLSEASFLAAGSLAIALGIVGLLRPGRWSIPLSALGILISYKLLGAYLPDPLIELEAAGSTFVLFFWDLPASLLYDHFGDHPVIVLLLWSLYLACLYAGGRTLALRIYPTFRSRLLDVLRGANFRLREALAGASHLHGGDGR